MSTPSRRSQRIGSHRPSPAEQIRRGLIAATLSLVIVGSGTLPRARAESPQGERMSHVVRIARNAMPMTEIWDMGADDLAIAGDQLVLRVSPSMLDQLRERGVTWDLVSDDVERDYREYRAAVTRPRAEPFNDYHDFESAVKFMQDLADDHPDIVALEVIGESTEERPIYALRISDNAHRIEPDEPAILVDGCHHAREWIAVEVPLFFADYLVSNYRKIGDVTRLVDHAEVWIVPILNPDGYVYTETDRFWRKTRRNNGDGSFGVDANRNYSIGWGDDAGSSGVTFSEVYRGPSPFSEPETQAIRDLMEGSFGRTFSTALSYHNFSQLVLYPNGYTTDLVDNNSEYARLSDEMVRRINASHSDPRHDYIGGPAARTLYTASGTSTDWAHHAVGAIAFIIEVRPIGFPGFELPPQEIIPTCQENLAAFLYLAEETLIPTLKSQDADGDGVLDGDDYCPSTVGSEIDDLGCGPDETDGDEDGIENHDDACGDSLPGQLVDASGCRVTPLFTVRISANVGAIPISVSPADIDAHSVGDADPNGFTRDYARSTIISLNAPQTHTGNRFSHWVIDGEEQPSGQLAVTLDRSTDLLAEATYVYPVRTMVVGLHRVPDTRDTGVGYVGNYAASIEYSDGSIEPASNVESWTIEDPTVAGLTANGHLVAYEVAEGVGEVATWLRATVDLGGAMLTTEPYRVSIYDRATRPARCRRLDLSGPDRVESAAPHSFTADVFLDGEFTARPADVRWSVFSGEGAEQVTPPAIIDDSGLMHTEPVGIDTSVIVRAVYLNEDDSACVAEKSVTIAKRAGRDVIGAGTSGASRASPCGATGLIPLLFAFMGLICVPKPQRDC